MATMTMKLAHALMRTVYEQAKRAHEEKLVKLKAILETTA